MEKTKLILKIGTNVLQKSDNSLDYDLIQNFTTLLSKLIKLGYEILIVSSGAIGAGKEIFKSQKKNK